MIEVLAGLRTNFTRDNVTHTLRRLLVERISQAPARADAAAAAASLAATCAAAAADSVAWDRGDGKTSTRLAKTKCKSRDNQECNGLYLQAMAHFNSCNQSLSHFLAEG